MKSGLLEYHNINISKLLMDQGLDPLKCSYCEEFYNLFVR